jgi:hypothetical protein
MIDTVTQGYSGFNPYLRRDSRIYDAVQKQAFLNKFAPSTYGYWNLSTGERPEERAAEGRDNSIKYNIKVRDKTEWEKNGGERYIPLDESDKNMLWGMNLGGKTWSRYLGMVEPAGTQFERTLPDGTTELVTAKEATIKDPQTGEPKITGNPALLIATGDVGVVLDNLNKRSQTFLEQIRDNENGAQPLYAFNYTAYDEEHGMELVHEFVGTVAEAAKLELAGNQIINKYGVKPYSSNVFSTFGNSFLYTLDGVKSGIFDMYAGMSDFIEASGNLVAGNGFHADYDAFNAYIDQMNWERRRHHRNNIGSVKADAGMFNNWISFSAALGQGAGSLAEYAAVGGATRALLSKTLNVTKALGSAAAKGLNSTAVTGTALNSVKNSKVYDLARNIGAELRINPENLGMVSAGLMINGGEAYQAAREAGLSLEDASIVAGISSIMMTAIELCLGANVVNRWAIGARGGKELAKDIATMYGGNLQAFNEPAVAANFVTKWVKKIAGGLEKVGSYGAVGGGIEEFSEEALQGLTKSTNEWLYDTLFADSEEVGKGYFGTNPLSGESITSYLEEGVIGGILGFGAGAIHGHRQRAQSILPFIARGDEKIVRDAVDYAYGQGALTEDQKKKVLTDVDAAIALRDTNKDLFREIAGYKTDIQGKISEVLLKELDAQAAFIAKSEGIHKLATSDDPAERAQYEDYWNELEGMLYNSLTQRVSTKYLKPDGKTSTGETYVLPIHTTNAFIKQLQDAGRFEEARMVKAAYDDASKKSSKYTPKVAKNATDSVRNAHRTVQHELLTAMAALNIHSRINTKKLEVLGREQLDIRNTNTASLAFSEIQNIYEQALAKIAPDIESDLKLYQESQEGRDKNDYRENRDNGDFSDLRDAENVRNELIDRIQQRLDSAMKDVEAKTETLKAEQGVIPFTDNLIKIANISLDQQIGQKSIEVLLNAEAINDKIEAVAFAQKALLEQNKANETTVGAEIPAEGSVKKTGRPEDDETGREREPGDLEEPKDISDNKDTEEPAFIPFPEDSAESLETVGHDETTQFSDGSVKTGDDFDSQDKLPKSDNVRSKETSDLINSGSVLNSDLSDGTFGVSANWQEIQKGKAKREQAVLLFNGLTSVEDYNALDAADKKTIIGYLPITYTFKHAGKYHTTYLMDVSNIGNISAKNWNYREKVVLALLASGEKSVKPAKSSVKRLPGYWNNVPNGTANRNNLLTSVRSLQLVKENGMYYHVTKRDANGKALEKRPFRIGIASRKNIIKYWEVKYSPDSGTIAGTERIASGFGSPGTPFMIIPRELTIGNGDKSGKKDTFVVKLNPRKPLDFGEERSRQLCNAVTDILSDIALGVTDESGDRSSRKSRILPGNKFGIIVDNNSSLNYDTLLDFLIFEGAQTLNNVGPDTDYSYLLNKVLRIIPDLGIIRYGFNEETQDHSVFNPSKTNPTYEEDRARFVDWMIRNKNMSVDFTKTAGIIEDSFEIAGFKAVKGELYTSWLIDNGIVQTDLHPTGTLLRNSAITFNGEIGGDQKTSKTGKSVREGKKASRDKKDVRDTRDVETAVQSEATETETEGTPDTSEISAIVAESKARLKALGESDSHGEPWVDDLGGWPFFKMDAVDVPETGYTSADLDFELKQYNRMFAFGGETKVVGKPISLSRNYFDRMRPTESDKDVKIRHIVDILRHSGNAKYAWGVMTLDGITVYDGAIEGVVYHEAFHRVSLLYLNPEERAAIYARARRQYNIPNATDNEVEEILAEKFRAYALQESAKYQVFPSDSIIQKFFKSLRKFLENLKFGLNSRKAPDLSTLEGLYQSIWRGSYNLSKPNKASVEAFKMRYPGYSVGMEVPVQTKDGKKVVQLEQVHDSVTFNKIVTALTSLTLNINGIEFVHDLGNKVSFDKPAQVIKSLLIDTHRAIVKMSENPRADVEVLNQLRVKADMYQEIYDTFGHVYAPAINQRLNYLGLRSKSVDDEMSEREDYKFFDGVKNDEISSTYEYSSKESASANIKLLFQTLRESSELDPHTFLPKYADYDTAWFNVMSLIHSSKTLDDMLNRLHVRGEEIARLRYKDRPNILEENYDWVNMYSSLVSKLEQSSETMRTQFWTTFKLHHYNFVNTYFNKRSGGYSYTQGSSYITKRSTSLARQWSAEFGVKGGHRKENRDAINAARRLWRPIHENAQLDKLGVNFGEIATDIVNALHGIGIPVDIATIEQATYNFPGANAMERLRGFILDTGRYNIEYLMQTFWKGNGHEFGGFYNQDIVDYYGKTLYPEDFLYSQKAVKELAKDYVTVHPVKEDDSIPGPDGNLVYANAQHSYLTQVIEEYLKDPDFIQQLLSEDINGSSLWLKQLLNPTVREKLQTVTPLNFLEDNAGDNGRGYLDISSVEDVIQKMSAIHRGLHTPPVLANKRTYHLIQGLETHEVVVGRNHDTGTIQIDGGTVDVFYNYFISERDAIVKAKTARQAFLKRNKLSLEQFNSMTEAEQDAFDYSDLVENYHYKTDKTGKTIILDGNGYHYRYFKTFENFSEKDLPVYIQPNFEQGTPQYDAFHKAENQKRLNIRNIIRKILIKQINKTVEKLADLYIITLSGPLTNTDETIASVKRQGDTTGNAIAILENKLMDVNHLHAVAKKYGFDDENDSGISSMAMIQAIADYAVNTAISSIEFDKVVHGDLAFFKNTDDRVKRYSALASTGLLLNSQVEDDVDFDTAEYKAVVFKSNMIKSDEVYGKLLNTYIGTTDASGKLVELYKKFRDDAGERGSKYARFRGKSDEELVEMATKDAETRLKGYLATDQTDGYVIAHPRFYRAVNKMIGTWSSEQEAAYNLLTSDEALTKEQELQAYHQVVMQPLKLMYFGKHFENGLGIATYDKPAYFTVFKRMVPGTDLETVFNMMDAKGISTAQFQSATKAGNRQGLRTYDGDGSFRKDLLESMTDEQLDKFIQPRYYKYLRRQLNTDTHAVYKIMLGTQAAKIGMSGIADDGEYFVGDDSTMTGSEVKQEWRGAVDELTRRGYDRLSDEWGFHQGADGTLTISREKFLQFLQKESKNTVMPVNLQDSLDVDENGDYVVHLSINPSVRWIQSKMLSLVKKRVIDINTPGNAMIQMSNFGFKNSDITVKKLDEGQISYRYGENKELSFRDPSNRPEAIMSISLFKQFLPLVPDKQGEKGAKRQMTFTEAREFILKNDISVMGYRIPTQGQNSIVPLHVVDLLPEPVGDTVILPAEFTTLTGSDFDIDKLYVANYNYELTPERDDILTDADQNRYNDLYDEFIHTINWSAKKHRALIRAFETDFDDFLSRMEFGASHGLTWRKSPENESDGSWKIAKKKPYELRKVRFDDSLENKWQQNRTEAVENRLLDLYMSVLTSDNHVLETTTPLDATTQPLKDAVAALDSIVDTTKLSDLEALFPSYQLQVKQQNTGADAGIGPMALANTNHTLTTMVDLEFLKESDYVNLLGLNSLHEKYDRNGVLTLDWLSALINAHVDAAKDPYILKLNVNRYTYSATTMLLRTGVGESTLYFMPQQILKDVADKYLQVFSGRLGVDPALKRNDKWAKQTVQKYRDALQEHLEKEAITIESMPDMNSYADYSGSNYIFDKDWLMSQLKVKEANRDALWYYNQLAIWEYFQNINTYGKALSELISATQIDTAKYGKNAAELLLFDNRVERAKVNPHFVNPGKMFTDTYLGEKYDKSVGMLFDVFGKEFLEFSPAFCDLIQRMLESSRNSYTTDARLVSGIANEIKTVITSEFFKQHAQFMEYDLNELFFGENSLVEEFKRLKSRIQTTESLNYLKGNLMLELLNPGAIQVKNSVEAGIPMLFHAAVGKNHDPMSMNDYTAAWRQLLSSTDDAVQVFAEKLILYAYYTSGGNPGGVHNLFNLVPFDVLAQQLYADQNVTYNDYMKGVISDAQTTERYRGLESAVYRNLWYNDDIVPEVGSYNPDDSDKLKSPYIEAQQVRGTKYTKYGLPVNIRMNELFARANTIGTVNSVPVYRPYIKFSKDGSSKRQDSVLYRFVGTIVKDGTTEGSNEIYVPVYRLVNKLGYRNKGYLLKEGYGAYQSIIPSNNVIDLPAGLSLMDTLWKPVYDPDAGERFIEYGSSEVSEVKDFEGVTDASGDATPSVDIHYGKTFNWSRYSDNGYEVSSQGDKRFSALNATLKDGRTIEEAYQLDVKGYRVQGNDWRLGKGKKPLKNLTQEESYKEYKNLWEKFLNENPDLEKDLIEKASGKTLTDKFASTRMSQARALAELLTVREALREDEANVLRETQSAETQSTASPSDALNPEQRKAVDQVIDFIKHGNPDEYFVVEGKAGTGKTFMIARAIQEARVSSVLVGALSHKAKEVIRDNFEGLGVSAEFASIAGMLGMKMDLETGQFNMNNDVSENTPIVGAELIIIDEASMVNEEILELLMSNKEPDAKVVFLGDIGQLPPIRSNSNDYYKDWNQTQLNKVSPVFANKNKAKLLTRVRQGEASPILPFADYYWDNSQSTHPVANPVPIRVDSITDVGALVFTNSINEIKQFVYDSFRKAVDTENPNHIKIVTYSNDTRSRYNHAIHRNLFGKDSADYNKGELIMFNDSFTVNKNVSFENSMECQIQAVSEPSTNSDGLVYYVLTIPFVDDEGVTTDRKIPVLAKNSLQRFREITSKKFADAKKLKSGNKGAYIQALRAAWAFKQSFADVDYAYAITSHKSQGSTYDIVVVDERDIMSIQPITSEAKSRSIYTAITRSRNVSVMVSPVNVDTKINRSLEAINDNINAKKGVKASEVRESRKIAKKTAAVENKSQSTPALKGDMTYSYNGNQAEGFEQYKTTFEAVKDGARTATTRYESQGNVDYWKNAKVGDTITWDSGKGETVDVVVTRPLYKIKGSGTNISQWSKMEGWSKDYFNSKVRPKLDEAWQLQYALPGTSGLEILPGEDFGDFAMRTAKNDISAEHNRYITDVYNQYKDELSGEKYGVQSLEEFMSELQQLDAEERVLLIEQLEKC